MGGLRILAFERKLEKLISLKLLLENHLEGLESPAISMLKLVLQYRGDGYSTCILQQVDIYTYICEEKKKLRNIQGAR